METFPYVKAAGVTQEAASDTFFLKGQSQDWTSNRAEVAAGVVVAGLTVVMFNGDNRLIAWDGTPGTAVGILAEPVDTTAGQPKWSPYYDGGGFNADALVWPAAIDTMPERRAAFARTNISVHRLP